MQWSGESKEAFVQALNIEFLTTVGAYTNFKFIKKHTPCSMSEVHMLFSDKQGKECKKYLQEIMDSYRNIITLPTIFNTEIFPFCISPGKLNSNSKRGVKFKVLLDEKIMHNLCNIFLSQLLSFKMVVTDIPIGINLNEDDRRNRKYVAGWMFSQAPDNPDLEKERKTEFLLNKYKFSMRTESAVHSNGIRYNYIFIHQEKVNEAVQRAIKDFPTKILRKYPTKLLTLFNVFYHDLSAKEEMSSDCKQFVRKTWAECVNTAKAQDNVVSFNYDGDDIDLMLDQQILCEINALYTVVLPKTHKDRAGKGTFSDFISLKQKDAMTNRLSFTFDLHNMNIIMNKVLCDVDYVEKAREFAINQHNGTARPIPVMDFSRTARAVNDAIPSSSRQNFLPIPGKSDDSSRSSVSSNRKNSTKSNKSDDSALGGSPSNPSYFKTSPELYVNAASFDSGHGSNLNSPIKKHRSDKSIPTTSPTHSDVTVINKNSGAGSVANIADLDNLESKPGEVKSRRGIRFHRGKSVPPCGKVLSIVKVEEGIKVKAEKRRSLDDVRVKV